MPRLNVVNPETATGHVKEIFDGPLQKKRFNMFKGLANSPAALDGYLALAGALNKAGLSAAQRETIALSISEANGCGYCTAAHTALGKAVGLSVEQTLQARRGRLDDPKLAAVAKLALTLHEKRGFVADEDLAAFRRAGFTDGHVAEVVAAYALNVFTNYFNHVNQSDVDFPAAPPL